MLHPDDLSWPFWPVVPLYPYGKRRTLRQEVIQNTLWTFDQLQGIFYVVVPIRMTIVKLDEGGLLVYAPIAPTPECIRLVQELVDQYGEIKYIILPTISGLEHKVFVGPFARHFPQAQVFVAPSQWSFPLNFPLSWLGFPPRRTQILPPNSHQSPFGDQFDYAILGPIDLGPGKFAEVAFFHRRSQTLLVTDSLVSLPENPPAIIQLDPYPLLFHAKDNPQDCREDNAENRRQGWQRICLFACYFQPSTLEVIEWGEAFRQAISAVDRSKKAYFGLFPFRWRNNWQQSFQALRGNGHLFVAPILQYLILNRAPQETLDWVNQIARWDFQQIIPCHFDSPIKADRQQLRQAFTFLEKKFSLGETLLEKDAQFMRELDESLYKRGIVPPPKEKI